MKKKTENKKWKEAKRALRRNVRMKLKLGYYSDLPVEPNKTRHVGEELGE